MVQEIVITVQNLLEEIACFGERIKKYVFCVCSHIQYYICTLVMEIERIELILA